MSPSTKVRGLPLVIKLRLARPPTTGVAPFIVERRQHLAYMKLRVCSADSAAASASESRAARGAGGGRRPCPARAEAGGDDRAAAPSGAHDPAASSTSASNTSALRPAVWRSAAWRRSIAAARRARKRGLALDVPAECASPNATWRASSCAASRATSRVHRVGRVLARGTTAATGSCPRRAPTAGRTRSRSRARRTASRATPGRRRSTARARRAEQRAPREHLDVARLVGGLDREQLHHLAKVRVQLRRGSAPARAARRSRSRSGTS